MNLMHRRYAEGLSQTQPLPPDAQQLLVGQDITTLDSALVFYAAYYSTHGIASLRKRLDELLLEHPYDELERALVIAGYSYLPMRAVSVGNLSVARELTDHVQRIDTSGFEEAYQRFFRYRLLIVRFFTESVSESDTVADNVTQALILAESLFDGGATDATPTIIGHAIHGYYNLKQGALRVALEHLAEIFRVVGLSTPDVAPQDVCRVVLTHEGLQTVPLHLTANESTIVTMLAVELINQRMIDEAIELQALIHDHSRTFDLSNTIWTNNLADALIDAGEHQSALSILDQVRNLHWERIPDLYKAYVLHNQARARFELGNVDEAVDAFEASLALSSALPYADILCNNRYQLARIQIGIGNVAAAEEHLRLAPYETDTVDPTSIARIRFLQQVIRSLRGEEYDETVALEAIEILDRESKSEALDARRELSGMYARQGRHQEAYDCMKVYTEERLGQVMRDHERRLRMIGIQHEIDLLHRQKQAMEEREIERQARYAELERKFGSANQSLMLTWNSLRELERNIESAMTEVRESKDLARKLKSLIRDSPVLSGSWESYLQVFTELYPNFQKALYEAAPQLTKMEVKVCILTLAEKKSEDIAALLYISSRTVETHRLSIRRKLNVPKQSSLFSALKMLASS